MYLTYDEYKTMGGALEAAAFERHAYWARSVIDRATHGRIQGEVPARESVRFLMRELVDVRAELAAHGGMEISSASNDGISVSYRDIGVSRADALVRDYLEWEATLDGVPLLYAGVAV